jgi:hypothetical protein
MLDLGEMWPRRARLAPAEANAELLRRALRWVQILKSTRLECGP